MEGVGVSPWAQQCPEPWESEVPSAIWAGGASLWQGMLEQMPWLHSCHRPLWPSCWRVQ